MEARRKVLPRPVEKTLKKLKYIFEHSEGNHFAFGKLYMPISYPVGRFVTFETFRIEIIIIVFLLSFKDFNVLPAGFLFCFFFCFIVIYSF